jgi:hypothetical protein
MYTTPPSFYQPEKNKSVLRGSVRGRMTRGYGTADKPALLGTDRDGWRSAENLILTPASLKAAKDFRNSGTQRIYLCSKIKKYGEKKAFLVFRY